MKFTFRITALITVMFGAVFVSFKTFTHRSNQSKTENFSHEDLVAIKSMNRAAGIPSDDEVFENIMSGSSQNNFPLPLDEAIRSAKDLMLQNYPDPIKQEHTPWAFDRVIRAPNSVRVYFKDDQKNREAVVVFEKFGEATIVLDPERREWSSRKGQPESADENR